MKDTKKHSQNLLSRWLDGSITAREEAKLDRAAQDDPWLMEAISGYRKHVETDHTEVLDRLRQQLQPEAKRRRLLPWMIRAAAVGSVVLAAMWWIWDAPSTFADKQAPMAMESQAENQALEKTTEQVIKEEVSIPEMEEATGIPEETSATGSNIMSPTRHSQQQVPTPSESIARDIATEAPVVAYQSTESVEEGALFKQAVETSPSLTDDIIADEEALTISSTMPLTDTIIGEIQASDLSESTAINNVSIAKDESNYHTLKGIVLDQDGHPLIGANILDLDNGQGVITDFSGEFQMTLDTTATSTVQITYAGFEDKEVVISPQKERLEIILEESADLLSEVVIVGLRKRSGRANSNISQSPNIRPEGGYRNLRRYIREHTPVGTPSGKVKVRFNILANGTVEDVLVLEYSDNRLAALAVKLITEGPAWSIQQGEAPIEIEYVVRFR